MIDPEIEAILLPILDGEKPFKQRILEVRQAYSNLKIRKEEKPKLRRDIPKTPLRIHDYREVATYFLSFLFRHFPMLESVEWSTYFEYDDQSGFGNEPEYIVINDNICISEPHYFVYDWHLNETEIFNAITIASLDPHQHILELWATMTTEEQAAFDAKVIAEFGSYDAYFEDYRTKQVPNYLNEHQMKEMVFVTGGLISSLEELCHSRNFGRMYDEDPEDYDMLEKHFPKSVKATREGVQFVMYQ